jgi:hypothetical protein
MRTLLVTFAVLVASSGCAHAGGTGPPVETGYPGAGPAPSSFPPPKSPVRAPECSTDADCAYDKAGRPGWTSRCVNAHCTQ